MSHHLGHQTDIPGFLGGGFPALLQQSPGGFSSQDPLEMYGGTALGSHAQGTERCGEGGSLTGEDDVTESRSCGPATDARTVDSRDDGLGELNEHIETSLVGLLDISLNCPDNKTNIKVFPNIKYYTLVMRL